MNRRSIILAFSLTFACIPLASAHQHGGSHEEEDTPLQLQMSQMNKSWKIIRRQIKDPQKNEATLALIAKVKKGMEESLKHTPILAGELAGAEKTQFMDDYKAGIKGSIELLGNLESALSAGDNANAQVLLSKINDARKKGHETFKPES